MDILGNELQLNWFGMDLAAEAKEPFVVIPREVFLARNRGRFSLLNTAALITYLLAHILLCHCVIREGGVSRFREFLIQKLIMSHDVILAAEWATRSINSADC